MAGYNPNGTMEIIVNGQVSGTVDNILMNGACSDRIVLTVSGSVICVSDVQPVNRLDVISVSEAGSVIVFSALHPLNAPL